MKEDLILIVSVLLVVVIGAIIFFSAIPVGRKIWNEWWYDVEKADDATDYETRKQVEDTCRAMISNYTARKLTYEQFANSTEVGERNLANQAQISANQIASEYNNYILRNSYVWKGNVPSDIYMELPYIH